MAVRGAGQATLNAFAVCILTGCSQWQLAQPAGSFDCLVNGYDEELGAFIVSEDCPWCGKQFTSGHAKHLKSCKGAVGGIV
jgi:hypothetical protein